MKWWLPEAGGYGKEQEMGVLLFGVHTCNWYLWDLFIPEIYSAIEDGKTEFAAYVVKDGELKEFQLKMAELTPDEKDIILKGCLINYYRG